MSETVAKVAKYILNAFAIGSATLFVAGTIRDQLSDD